MKHYVANCLKRCGLVQILTFGMLLLSLSILIFYFCGNSYEKNSYRYSSITRANTIGDAFKDNDTHFFILFCCCISTSMPVIVDIMFEILMAPKNTHNSNETIYERLALIVLNVVNSFIIIVNISSESIARIYSAIHLIQFSGSLSVVLYLCHKLCPEFFKANLVIWTCLYGWLGSFFSFVTFGTPISGSYAIVYVILYSNLGLVGYFLLKMAIPWIQDLNQKYWNSVSFTPQETCCYLVFISYFCFFFAVHVIPSLIKGINWTTMDETDIFIFVISYTLLSILVSSIPVRLSSTMVLLEIAVEKKEYKEAMLRFIAHEVRTPLNIIQHSLTFLGDVQNNIETKCKIIRSQTQELFDEFKILVEGIESQCSATVSILSDTLDYEQLKYDELRLKKEYVDIVDFFRDVEKMGSKLCFEKSLKFKVNFDDLCLDSSALCLSCDRFRMLQVMQNLLRHAVMYTHEGSITIKVTSTSRSLACRSESPLQDPATLISPTCLSHFAPIRFIQQKLLVTSVMPEQGQPQEPIISNSLKDQILRIDVIDTGIGIALEDQHLIFDDCYQSELRGGGIR